MYALQHGARLLGLAIVVGLVFSIGLGSSALAANPIFQTSPLNDRFASDAGQGADGFAKVRTVQQGSLVFDSVIAKNLEPNTPYEIHVADTPGPGFVFDEIVCNKRVDVTTNGGGVIHVRDIDLSGCGPGTYRVDVLVTPAEDSGNPENVPALHPLLPLIAAIDRDILLACQPAFTVTVE